MSRKSGERPFKWGEELVVVVNGINIHGYYWGTSDSRGKIHINAFRVRSKGTGWDVDPKDVRRKSELKRSL